MFASLRRLFSQTETLELFLLYIRERGGGALHALSDDADVVQLLSLWFQFCFLVTFIVLLFFSQHEQQLEGFIASVIS